MTSHHVVPVKIYFCIFAALLALTGITTAVAYVDLGFLNTVVALTIAVCKALLVILYFMHVRYSNRLIWLYAAAGFFWLVLLIGLGMSDFLTRNVIPFPGS